MNITDYYRNKINVCSHFCKRLPAHFSSLAPPPQKKTKTTKQNPVPSIKTPNKVGSARERGGGGVK